MAAGSNESERGSFLQSPLDQINEQEQKLVELRRSKGPFDRAVRALTTNIRESYESMILENLSTSEAIEQQLWRLHYSFIEEFRARLGKLKAAAVAAANVPNKKKAVEKQKFERVGGQYKCFLDEATGFYHGLIAKLGAKHGLSGKLPSLSNRTEISSSNKRFRRSQCVCHRCYIYLGDLARYKELHLVVEGRTADWYVAANYYRQASALWPAGGNPHNQLGVLATYAGDNLQALYHYMYSLAVTVPFSTARANAKLLIEKNQRHNSQLSNSPEDDVAIDIEMAQAFDSHKSSTESHQECPLARLQRRFRVHFITLVGLLFNKSGLEEFSELSSLVLREAQLLLSQDNTLITSSFTLEKSNRFKNQAFSVVQLIVLLIFSVHSIGSKRDKSSRNMDRLEMSPVVMQATTFAFQFMTVALQHCTRTEEPCCSSLFPAVVVFCNWLSNYPDFCQQIQGDEECGKLQCSFVKEVCVLLSKCVQQIGTARNLDNDSIAFSEKEGLHGNETVLWEDKELCGIGPLKYSETSETASKLSVVTKNAHNVADSACVVRVERLLKALTFLGSVLKLDSSVHDAIAAVGKSPFGWASMRATPSELVRCSQSSGGSVRTGDGSMELRTQGPFIMQRSTENTPPSHFRKEDCLLPKTSDRTSDIAVPATNASLPSEAPVQPNIITERELNVCPVLEGSTLQQPESEPCDNNLETMLEDTVHNNVEHKDDATLCSVGRGALSLGDWVKATSGGDENVDASPGVMKRTDSRQGASQQAQTHSSGEESLNPSLSFKVVSIPTPLVPSRGDAEVDDTRVEEPPADFSGVRIEIDTHATLSLNPQDSVRDRVDLGRGGTHNTEKDATTLNEDPDLSKSRKRKLLSPEPSKAVSPDCHEPVQQCEEVTLGGDLRNCKKQKLAPCEPSKGSSPENSKGCEAGHQSEEVGSKKSGDGVDIEPEKENPSAASVEGVCPVVHVTRSQEPSNFPQLMVGQSVQSSPNHDVASNRQNHLIDGGSERQGPALLDNQKSDSSVGTPKKGVEDFCATTSGRGKKRNYDAIPPLARSALPSTRCQNCQGTSPGAGTSERTKGPAPQSRTCHNDSDAVCSSQQGQGSCMEPNPCSSLGSDVERRTGCPPKRSRMKEWDSDEFDNWLETFTHVVPQALTKLASAMRKASYSLSDFGVFLEFGAQMNSAKFKSAMERTMANNEHPFCSNC